MNKLPKHTTERSSFPTSGYESRSSESGGNTSFYPMTFACNASKHKFNNKINNQFRSMFNYKKQLGLTKITTNCSKSDNNKCNNKMKTQTE